METHTIPAGAHPYTRDVNTRPLLVTVLPPLAEEVETSLRRAGREALADTVPALRIYRCTANSGSAYIYFTKNNVTAREIQLLRGRKDVTPGELERHLALTYRWPPDETLVSRTVRICIWSDAVERLTVTRPGVLRPELRKLAKRLP